MTAVSDNFGGTLAAWTALVGTFSIVGGKLRSTNIGGSTGNYQRYDTSTDSVDCFAQGVVSSTQADGSSNTGMACRMRAAANTSYQVTGRHAGDTLMVWRIVNGANETQLTWQAAVQNLPVTWGSGDTLREEVIGSLIRAKVNGVVVGFCIDTTITDGQLVGVNSYNGSSGDFAEWDNFDGGALIADGGLVAGFVSGIGAQTARSTAANPTPTIPASVAAGQLVIAQGTIRSTTETLAPPAGEGWSQIELASGNSLRTYVWAKVWGLGGQTDDTTPTFTRTGTTGAFVTCSLLTNPLHSTSPWTSVASAVAASGNQSNAAAAACTAPAVSGNWTHATVVRLFSSADDNALNTPSAGTALVYGAAAYDATDIAQAMTVAEDITVTTNTGTATVQETVNGNDANNGVTLVVVIPTSTNGTATPAAITATATLPAPSVTGVSQAQPSAITATTALPAPSVSGAATASPAAVAAPVSLPPPTVVGQTVVQPATITAVAAAPSPGVSTGAGPGVVAATASLPTPSATGASTATPAVIPAPVSLPAPSVLGQTLVQPATIATTAALPTPGISTGAGPATIPSTVTLLAPSTTGSAAATPATIIAAVSLPAPAPSATGTAQPPTIELLAALPAPGISSGVTPGTITAVAAVPTPSVSAGGSVSVSPAAIQTIVSLLAPGVSAGASPTPASISATAALPAPSATGGTGATASPATIAALVTLPPPAASGQSAATASPATIALVVLLPQAFATGGIDPELIGRVVFFTRASPAVDADVVVVPLVAAESHVVKRVLFDSQVEEVANVELDASAT